ncbi:hypothetical protein SLS62_006711 [Diatrype stigma]|uniref:F-box domain-containing protein n=1 Tax=Diatrype stigma TaxID=117547 RepID=A0AAN9UMR5_9PEZI
MQFLEPHDILRLRSTSKEFRDKLEPVLAAMFDINASLRQFFEKPAEFRTQLGHCNALIHGDLPLRFFQRTIRPDTLLSIMIEDHRSFTLLEDYILKGGYCVTEDARIHTLRNL